MTYTKPTPADMRARFPEFSAVEDDMQIQYWLTDAERSVDETWREVDYPVALMLVAADSMARGGFLASDSEDAIPVGVTSLKSGNLSITRTSEAASDGYAGDYTGTKYGRQFLQLLRLNKGGPRVTDTGVVPAWGLGYDVPWFAAGGLRY